MILCRHSISIIPYYENYRYSYRPAQRRLPASPSTPQRGARPARRLLRLGQGHCPCAALGPAWFMSTTRPLTICRNARWAAWVSPAMDRVLAASTAGRIHRVAMAHSERIGRALSDLRRNLKSKRTALPQINPAPRSKETANPAQVAPQRKPSYVSILDL